MIRDNFYSRNNGIVNCSKILCVTGCSANRDLIYNKHTYEIPIPTKIELDFSTTSGTN